MKLCDTHLTLSAQLVRALEDEIVSGRLINGVHLDEQRLANWFNVSRTPVREALRELVVTGLVEKRARRGFIVRRMDQTELFNLFETMATLEATCGRYAAERISDQAISTLSGLLEEMDHVASTHDADLYEKLNRQLHELIYQGTNNNSLVELASSVRRRVAPFRRAQFQLSDRIITSQREHRAIIQAITSRNASAAYDHLFSHIMSAHDSASEYLSQLNEKLVLGLANIQ